MVIGSRTENSPCPRERGERERQEGGRESQEVTNPCPRERGEREAREGEREPRGYEPLALRY